MSDPRTPARRVPSERPPAPTPDDDLLIELARIVAEAAPAAQVPVAQPRAVAEPAPEAPPPRPAAEARAPAQAAPSRPAAKPPLDDDLDDFDRALSAELDGAVARLSRQPPAGRTGGEPAQPGRIAAAVPAARPTPAVEQHAARPRPAAPAPEASASRAPAGPAPSDHASAGRAPVPAPVVRAPAHPAPADHPPAGDAPAAARAEMPAAAPRPAARAAPEAAKPAERRPETGRAEAPASAATPPAAPAAATAPDEASPREAPARRDVAAPKAAVHDPLDFDWEPAPVRKPATAGPVPTATDTVPFDFAAFEEELSASIGVEAPADAVPVVRGLDVDAFEADLLADLGASVSPPPPAAPAAAPAIAPEPPMEALRRRGNGKAARDAAAVEAMPPLAPMATDPLAALAEPTSADVLQDELPAPFDAPDDDYDVLPPHSRAERRAARSGIRRRGRSRVGLAAIAAGVVVIAVGAGAYWLVGGRSLTEEGPQFVAAEEGPVKVAPPGSEEAQAGGDPSKAFYDRVAEVNDPAKQALGREQIIIPPGNQGPGGGEALPGVPNAGGAGAESAGTAAEPGDPTTPKKVRTVIVRPDGTIIAAPETETAGTEPQASAAPLGPSATAPTTFETAAVDATTPTEPAAAPPGGLPGDVAAPGEMTGVTAGDVGTPMPPRKPLVVEDVGAERPRLPGEPDISQAKPLFGSAPGATGTAVAEAPAAPPAPVAATQPLPVVPPTPAPAPQQPTTAADGTRTVATAPVRVSALPQARSDATPPPAAAAQPAAPTAATPPSGSRSSWIPPAQTVPGAQQPAAPAAPAAPQETAAVAPAATAPAAAGPFLVQLSSQRSEADAKKAYAALQKRFPSILGGRTPVIQSADLGTRGIYYRVRLPAGSAEEANRLCSEIKAAGGDCLVSRK